jgi:NADPH:quinone reductase-like Zn-dependent oxidoreductase
VCGTQRVAFVRELGADHVIDYTREALGAAGGVYDVIVDILGRSSFAACRELLTPDGCYLRVSFKLRELLQMAWTSRRGGRRVICALSNETPADLEAIRQLVEAGVIRSVIDRRYPLEQTAEAHRYLESGARHGPVVIEPA